MYILFTILLTFILQIQVLPKLGIQVDLLLLVTLYYGFLYGWKKGLGVGLVSGLLQDIFSFGTLAMAPVGLIICGLLAGYTRQILLLRYWIVRVALVFLLTILNLAIYFCLSKIFSQDKIYMFSNMKWLVISLSNMVLAGIVFWLVDRYG